MIYIYFIVQKESIKGFDDRIMLKHFQDLMDIIKIPEKYRRETSGIEQITETGVKFIRF